MSRGPQLDPLARLDILAAALPGSTLVSREIGTPLASVWAVIEDLERFVPLYESAVIQAVGESEAGRRVLRVTYESGLRETFVVRLAPGWCLMQSPSFVAAFAAASAERGTLLAHLEHWRLPGRPSVAASKLEGELMEIERLARSDS
jgi:hypothetical protein